jgi:hypothetical protein
MSDRERRLGFNEAVFREVNERVKEIKETFESTALFASQTDALDLLCECGDASCTDKISMPVAEYERVRADSLQFAVVPGHADRQAEDVIAHETGYDVVRKRGEAAAAAEATSAREDLDDPHVDAVT